MPLFKPKNDQNTPPKRPKDDSKTTFFQKTNTLYTHLFPTFFNNSPKLLSLFFRPKNVNNCCFALKTHSVNHFS